MLVHDIPKIEVCGVEGLEIHISDSVLRAWELFKQKTSRSREACGVLIGGYNSKLNRLIVDQCTLPQKRDLRKKTFFELKDPKHQKQIDRAHRKSKGRSFYLGTWHTHPEKYPNPSSLDIQDWEYCIARNPDTKLFAFSIVGTEQTKFFTFRRNINENDEDTC